MDTQESGDRLHRVLRAGQTLAFLGLALQLIGIAWDGVLHHFDATLAGRESVFTLTNPSHLLLATGLGLTVVGVSLIFLGFGWGKTRARREAVAATIALTLLGAGVAVVAIFTEGSALFGSNHHGPKGAIARVPELEEVLRKEGTEAAIARLTELAEQRPNVEADAHQIIHDIGRASFALHGDIARSFGECTEDFQSGCYHGAIEAYSAARGSLGPDDVRSLCEFATSTPDASKIIRFECLHGLGHGLTSHLAHDLIDALYHCDYLRGDWDRKACYGGVFMENIMFWSFPPDHHADPHTPGDHDVFVKEDDPHYPCNVLSERYVHSCYKMQTSIILRLNGFDFSAGFRECDRAPRKYRFTCYESMGRDISSFTLRDQDESLRLCRLGTDSNEPGCYTGVARNMTAIGWDPSDAISFCSHAPRRARARCFTSVGYDISIISGDPGEARSLCLEARMPSLITACRQGLRMMDSSQTT